MISIYFHKIRFAEMFLLLFMNLTDQRAKFTFRIKKGAAELVQQHKYARCLKVYLELKPFFINSTFRPNAKGHYCYAEIAAALQISESSCRGFLKQLEQLKLLRKDIYKNIIVIKG